MRRAKNKGNLIEPQGIARRLRNRRGKTGKVKLKACSVILRDIFKFDTDACVKETAPSSRSVTASAIDISTESGAKENIQKVTSNDVDTDRTAELTISLRDPGVCVPGNDADTDSSVEAKTAPGETTEITPEYTNREETSEVAATLRDKGDSSRNDDGKEELSSEI